VVLYLEKSDHKSGRKEIRLPGGTVQFVDITNGVKSSADRLKMPADKLNWLLAEINRISNYFSKTTESMPANSNADKLAIREIFVNCLSQASDAIASVLTDESHVNIVESECRLQTLKRELADECAVGEYGNPVESGMVNRKGHIQIPYLIMDSDAPDMYRGSSDDDILESTFMPVNKVYEVLFQNHKPFLNSTLNKLAFIWSYDSEKKIFSKQIDSILQQNV
jgi:hypothetical protein